MELINLQTNIFENQLLQLINNSGLPIANAYLVLRDVYKQITQLYQQQLKKEAAAVEQENNKTDSEEDSVETVTKTEEADE